MPNTLYRSVAILCALALWSIPASAQQAAAPKPPAYTAGHLAAARELIQMTGGLTAVDEMLPAFGDQIKKASVARPELSKDLDDVLAKLKPELDMQKQQAVNLVATTYAKFLTEQEIRDTIAFFKTPSGAKYIGIQSQLVDEAVDDVTAWSQQAGEYVMVRVRAEMGKRGFQLQ